MAKGKWAQGIQPRNFSWIMKDRLAISERPGGYGVNHRRVRRQEEIIWIREQGFTEVISIIPAPHNLHNYDELGVAWRHRPFQVHEDPAEFMAGFYPELRDALAGGAKLLVHGDEVNDRLCGLITGYVVWSGLVTHTPDATSLVERLVGRQVGPIGRELVGVAAGLSTAGGAGASA